MVKHIDLEDGIVEKNWQSAEVYMSSQSNKLKDAGINWLIIGAQTKPYKPPRIEWVQEIVEAADKSGIPVFLKDNLNDIVPPNTDQEPFLRYGPAGELRLRQEFPKVKVTAHLGYIEK